MYSPQKKLVAPEQYGFPHIPYAIQTELMKSLYNVLEEKQIGIFESPTGTGKSLTLTCAALRWLEDHEQLLRDELRLRISEKETEICNLESQSLKAADWINAQYETNQQRMELSELRCLNVLVEDFDQGLKEIRERQLDRKTHPRNKHKINSITAKVDSETLDDEECRKTALEIELNNILKTELGDAKEADEETKRFRPVQIFFCSRTHSQLAQVVNEIRRTEYGRRIRCVTLGSRQQLCVNPQVRRLKNTALMNERCLDMSQKHKGTKLTKSNVVEITADKVGCACPFKTANAVQTLGEAALVDILDIEDLAIQGNEQKACAYYAARSAATAGAQLVMLPYQMVLHQRTRRRSGIELQGSIIIIDEAHNLLDTIVQLHSCEISLQQLNDIKDAIVAYKSRYVKLFSAPNLLCINQLLYVVRRLAKLLDSKMPLGCLASQQATVKSSCRTLRTYELSAEGDFFNIDLYELLQFCERTRFAQKLLGFAKAGGTQSSQPKENCLPEIKETTATVRLLQRLQQEKAQNQHGKCKKKSNNSDANSDAPGIATKVEPNTESVASISIYALITFLEALTENADDGRVLVYVDGTTNGSHYRYTVLNPSRYFEDIVREARAIVIAGGTMQPTNELTEQLFRSCAARVRLHFYDHVVSKEAVLPFVVQSGTTGKRLCFNYTQRSSVDMLIELGMILQNLCQVVPAGIVCFLPSYDFLDKVYDHLRSTNILTNILAKKSIFRESRATQKEQSVEQLLKDYADAIQQKGGAFLLSVVGGKLSEGLNFKDNLCRGVIVVGMPYANSQSIELQERMRYMDSTLGTGAGNQYYENLCMKAVNQCIGRAVRHIRDYAAVYLLDERYSQEHIRKKLPQWIARSLQLPASFGVVQSTTAKFFKQKREQTKITL